MKRIKKWALYITVTGLLIAGILVTLVLNPILTYAHKTTHHNFSVFHSKPVDNSFLAELDQAASLIKKSEFYNPGLKLDICLNDGSAYPQLIKAFRGRAFAWGFYNKVVLQGKANYKDDHVELDGYKWNLTQLLAHEMTHCLQYDKLGFWRSKPVANIPDWKWEGYAEYVSRQANDQTDLARNITRFKTTAQDRWAINFADSTIAPRDYYAYWILVQYCIDIKKMNYRQLLKDTAKEQAVREEMFSWYKQNHIQ